MPPTGGVTDNGLRCESVEPRRSYPGDGEQRWYDGEDWERGRHGAPDSPPGAGAAYNGEDAAFSGADGYERRFNSARFSDPLTDSASGAIPVVGADPVEPARRPVEAIDVASLRRAPVSSPPDDPAPAYPPEYGSPPAEFPPANYAAPPAEFPPANYAAPPPPYPQPAEPYPAGSMYGTGSNPLSAPTAAVSTIQPSPSVYHSRKPAIAIVLAVLTVVFEIPALRLLGAATIADVVPVSGVVAGTFLVLGLPVAAYGVYGLLNGPSPNTLAAWLRVPVLYLPLGVLLFLLAALAAA
jgi:hypothetical protein